MKAAWFVLSIFLVAAAAWLIWKSREAAAKVHQTSGDALRLQRGISSYDDAYHKLPTFTTPMISMEGPGGRAFLFELLGEAPASISGSVRTMCFMDPRPSDHRSKGGLIYDDPVEMKAPQGFYDAWGEPFRVAFDHDNNGEILDPLNPGNIIRGKRSVVFSYGLDKKPGGGDDIKTW